MIVMDLGGTHLRAAVVNSKGRFGPLIKKVVGSNRSQKAMIAFIGEIYKKISQGKKLSLSLGIPGIILATTGIVFSSPHFPQWKNFKIKSELQKKLKVPVCIDNDANLIALGEHKKGAATDWPTFLMVTLGTGIGGALVIDSKIFHGTLGFAGEFGHICINPKGPPCTCGGRGCLELYASASGLERLVGAQHAVPLLQSISRSQLGEKLFILARKKNRAVQKILNQFGFDLGIGLAALVNVTGIQKIVIGGGLLFLAPFYWDAMKKSFKGHIYPKIGRETLFRKGKLGDRAGLVGALFSKPF